MNFCFLDESVKYQCVGCESCVQICSKSAITIKEDVEGFRYPVIDSDKCVNCGLCRKVCPITNMPVRYIENKLAFGGSIRNDEVKKESTSGGAFSAIVEAWCDENYVIFGAESKGLDVYHSYITDKVHLSKYRKSKYLQSKIGNAYKDARQFLKEGKKVLFSGTPCQIAGLKAFLQNTPISNLLTVEVICEGVPTPHYIRRYSEYMGHKYGGAITYIDYRYKDNNKWDFQVMLLNITSKSHPIVTFKCDRWFNPFWSIWLNHLMSRPSCYECKFANTSRVADITLGDLWGVHLYCPELYGHNKGASLIVCNTENGKIAFKQARSLLDGHDLKFEDVLRYQSPMRQCISSNPNREQFMRDVLIMDYKKLIKKWSKRPSVKLLYQKYVWGNRQKVFFWNLNQKIKGIFR